MMPAAKHGDPQLGVDIHLCVVPPSPSPVPLPTPHMSVVFDPFDYVPYIGATVEVCGMKRATAGTNAIVVHIPPGFPFAPKLPDKDDELFMGSSTVVADGDPFSFIAVPVLGCQVVGMPGIPRLKKKGPPKVMLLPTTFNLAIPTTVFVGGPPTISLMGMAFKGAFAALGKFAKSGLFKRIRQKVFGGLNPGWLKCKVLRAEPVNTLTGEVVVEQEDFLLAGRIPLQWARSYSSGSTRAGVCGHGWETPADIRLEVDASDGAVTMRHPLVGPLFFAALPARVGDEAAELELVDGARLTDTGDELRVQTKDDHVYHFPKTLGGTRGQSRTEYPIGQVSDLCGNWLVFDRRARDVVSIRESAGRRIELVMRGGLLREIAVVDPVTVSTHVFARYEYDHAGDLITVRDALDAPYTFRYRDHHLIRHTDRVGLSFYYEYDPNGPDGWRVVHSWGDGGLYDYRFAYDDTLNERRITNSLGHVALLKLDESGLPIAEIDALGGLTSYQYDDCGRTIAVTDADGLNTGYEYDTRGNVVAITRPDGNRITYEYNDGDKAIAITGANGATWLRRWDARGLLVEEVSPLEHSTRYEYDEHGTLLGYTDPRGALTRFEYDRVGRLAGMTDARGNVTAFTQNALWRTAARTDPLGRRTLYKYDAKARLTEVTLPSGQTFRCAYDAESNLVEYVDADGGATRLEYFGQGYVARRRSPDGHDVSYLYDTEEQLVAMRNQRGEVYELRRDSLGRIVEEIDYWGQSRRFEYTPAGRLRESTDPLGRAIHYSADPMGRIVRKTMSDPIGGADAWQETFAYDATGNVIAAANPHVRIEREFDPEGQLIRDHQRHQSGAWFVVHSRYDAVGNRIERRSEGSDESGPIPGHLLQWIYDPLNEPVALRVDEGSARHIQRAGPSQLDVELAPGLKRQALYDDRGRMIAQAVTRGADRLFVTRYQYDAANNLTDRLDTQLGADRFTYDPVGRVLEHADPSGDLQRFLTDPAGDRWRTEGSPAGEASAERWSRELTLDGITCLFDAAGNLVRKEDGQGSVELQWDAAQRLTASHNSVTQGAEGKSSTTHYGYDPLGRRSFKETNGRMTWFGWDGDHLAFDCERNPAGRVPGDAGSVVAGTSEAREYVYQPASFEPAAVLVHRQVTRGQPWSELLLHYVNDPNGAPVRALDDDGNVRWAASYKAWGRTRVLHVDEVDNPIRLQGQYADPETGLHYNRYRYYDPDAGTFVSQDPLGVQAGFNLYELAPNVLGWADPLGLTDCEITVFRVQPKSATGDVTGGAHRRALEAGKSAAEAERIRKELMDACSSSDPKKRVKALQDAQASGAKSPFISTTKNEAKARENLEDLRNRGIDAEMVTIRGPKDKGTDFEETFDSLGGRTSPSRQAKDPQMEEFGIPDTSVPPTGKSDSGFEIIKRE